MPQQIHIIHRNSKALALHRPSLVRTKSITHYTVGFRSSQQAHRIMYTMDFENTEDFIMLPDENAVTMREPITNTTLTIHGQATLFVPKKTQDAEFYQFFDEVKPVSYDDFLVYPVTHGTGIVIPFFLITEDDTEYVYCAHAIDPIN